MMGGSFTVDGGSFTVDGGSFTVDGGSFTVDGGSFTVDGELSRGLDSSPAILSLAFFFLNTAAEVASFSCQLGI
ncbi:hypothetical protein E4U82_06630 [Lentibacillus salicampi]|uniref:Uncharacterized protein n=1 Tax=Lentibacillus salicampi TaxID=175306 RepID=A0A4Y9ACM6_9BACI|nr:hypothetical protein E4U82_06630 [Lentibacillus salicampi]